MILYGKCGFVLLRRLIAGIVFSGLLVLPVQAQTPQCSCKNDDETVVVSGRTAVFYTLSQAEFGSLDPEDQEAYTELLSDFYEYAVRLGRYFDKHGIKRMLTGSRCFKIATGKNVRCYDKITFKEEVGVLLSNGKKEPKVIPGIFTDAEVLPDIREYYLLKE